MQPSVKLIGHQLVLRELDALDGRVRTAAEGALRRGLLYAAGLAQREYLRGPRPQRLGVRSGRLLGSLTTKVEASQDRITGALGTNVPYGAFHEFGFHGTQSVRGHTRVIRQISGGGKLMAGRIGDIGTPAPTGASKQKAGKQKSGFAEIEFVKPHTRTLDYQGRPFVRPALRDATPRILRELNTAVKAALTGAP